MNFFKLIFMGLIIGMASILPGLSGGVLAISLGVYEKALNTIVNLKKEFKKGVLFLAPLGIGAVIGIFLFGVIMSPLLEKYEITVIFLFTGFVLGSLPSFLKQSTQKGFKITYLIPMLITFIIGMLFSKSAENIAQNNDVSALILFLSGGILSLGMLVPGISSSFFLMQMGVYDNIINAIISINIYYIFFVGFGFVIISLLLVKLLQTAFKRFQGYAHFAALGFLISSVIGVFPGFQSGINLIIDLFALSIGAVFVYFFMKKK